MGLLIVLSGCRVREVQHSHMYERFSRVRKNNATGEVTDLVSSGAAEVVSQCEAASFANVWKGLVAGQTGLHEDVFEMRDPASLKADAYRLDDTLQLEGMLEAVSRAGAGSSSQTECVQSFADNLEAMTDPMVEADKLQKEIDLSAFTKAAKEAQQDKQHELETPALPEISPAPAQQR